MAREYYFQKSKKGTIELVFIGSNSLRDIMNTIHGGFRDVDLNKISISSKKASSQITFAVKLEDIPAETLNKFKFD